MDNKASKQFFLISFLPAIAYWYLEEHYSLKIALIGGIALAIIELVVEKIFTKHLHTLSIFNFFLIVFLGGLSLLGEDGIWFKLQPCFTGLAMGGFLLWKLWKGQGMLLEMAQTMGNQLSMPPAFFKQIEKHLALFFVGYGCFMLPIALFFSTDIWLFFKTAGFYIATFIFMLAEMILIRRAAKKLYLQNMQAQSLSRFNPNPIERDKL